MNEANCIGSHVRQTSLLIRRILSNFDEMWLVGAKGDYCDNLIKLGIIEEANVNVVHVHSPLGSSFSNAKIFLPDRRSSGSFLGIFTSLNKNIQLEVERIGRERKRVVLFMPFPNKELDDMIKSQGLENSFYSTAPVADSELYQLLEDKSMLCEIVPQDVLIRSIEVSSIKDIKSIQERLGVGNNGFILQQCMSAGGSGTYMIKNQQDFNDAISDMTNYGSKKIAIKASVEITNAYPANGSGCVVPISKSKCKVYIDPLSHKLVETEKTSEHQYGSLGNDWTVIWPNLVNKKYIETVEYIGHKLYDKWGYTGMFGVDFLVRRSEFDRGFGLYVTEINPRWQGTTPYQTCNAILSNRIPLELVNHIIKLSDDKVCPPSLQSMLGPADDYNLRSVNSTGVFYIKIYAPDSPRVIKNNASGWWTIDNNVVRKVDTKQNSITETNDYHILLKAPPKGTIVGRDFAAICYAYGDRGGPIFDKSVPRKTKLYDLIKDNTEKILYEDI